MLLIILLSITSFIVWLVHWYYTVNNYEKYLKKIPGPKRIPLFGNAFALASSITILPKLMEYMKTFKGNFKFYIGSLPYFLICEPKDLEFVFSSPATQTKSDAYRFLHNWIGLGLLNSGGNRWRKHRKILTPAFHFQILEDFIEVFNSSGGILVSKLKAHSGKGSFDIYPYITRCTLDIICETAMGTSVNAQDDLESEYVNCVNKMLEISTIRTFSPIHASDYLYPFTRTYWREKSALKVLHGYTKSVINRRKTQYNLINKDQVQVEDAYGRKKRRAFLDLLLEYTSKDSTFTEDDLQQEVDTFMFEGHDTTATSITFTLYALAINPDVQKKAYAELQEIFADDPKRDATHRDLQEMKYLEMVIKEALRIYTTVPFIGRVLEKDTDWNGTILPEGLNIMIFTYGVLNSPFLYEDPEKFNPDRHTVEATKERNAYAYVPFSAGARNCIGQKFAMLEMKSTVSDILRNFELLPPVPDHKMVLKNEGVLKSDNGVYVRLRSREDHA